ncbi:ornithine cyclodeaminase family protein [Streptomyces sp. NBC_00503]|uniref:ornithine cyclodeaminase family protein n=1 Tax=Streptomyces sp. NBC_00503 TaxID=2903659 RepID=UPI002E822F7F|nr:ornithine cyclodeaminase family protein [Streptomyces sp. NBC_00503]WUD84108.1 ornithine cyclodeaminase family protein [Streptomyces sp. NBC_00503]
MEHHIEGRERHSENSGSSSSPTLFYLTRAEVAQALEQIDVVSVAADTLRAHGRGDTTVPDEAYMGWTTRDGHSARNLNMPGFIDGPERAIGTKIINASLGNTARGIPRADGVTLLFDPETAHPYAMMDAALISATRTAAVSVAAIEALAPRPVEVLGLIGCGTQSDTHLRLLLSRHAALRTVQVYDRDPSYAAAFAERHGAVAAAHGVKITVMVDAEHAVRGADVVIPLTTVTEGYIRHAWLRPDAVVVHVSLDDLLPEVVLQASRLVVDDWNLVRSDPRRLLGRMYREGSLYWHGDTPPGPDAKAVDGELGSYLNGEFPSGGLPGEGVTVVNPFGMSVQDVALAHRVVATARELGSGTHLAR